MHLPSSIGAVPALLLVAAAGCSAGSAQPAGAGGAAPPGGISVRITPAEVELAPSFVFTFAATVTGSSDRAVQWSADGGTIAQSGRYVTAASPGTYHVVATSHADPSHSATATVTVSTTPPPPSLTVSPRTATVTAGGSGAPLSATLRNATGTITWSRAPAIGALSATTGTPVTYTPPAALEVETVVTVTASAAGLTDSAAITVVPAATPGAAVIANHLTVDPSVVPLATLNVARAHDVLFGHQSVGNDIMNGLVALRSADATRYSVVIGGEYWAPLWANPSASWLSSSDGVASRYVGTNGEPLLKIAEFRTLLLATADGGGGFGAVVDVALMKLCFVDVHWITTDARITELWTEYRDTMLELMGRFPSVKFVWTTMPISTIGDAAAGENGRRRDAYNALVRAHVAANGGYLLDVADLETYSGDTPTRSSDGYESLSPSWSLSSNDAHLNAAGAQRVARAWWYLMARIAGWTP